MVLFLDAAHFVQGVFLGYVWCVCRRFLPSSSGRRRWNVLGALDVIRQKVHTLCNDTYINSQSVCELLANVRRFYGEMPISIFLDNARYQRCDWVRSCAEQLGIRLEFLPTYSPHLNLIERYWKFVKKKCLNARYHENFEGFRKTIDECIATAHEKYPDELKSLLSLEFQTFKNVQILVD